MTDFRRRSVFGAAVTTVAVGGFLPNVFEPDSVQELEALLDHLASERSTYRILGAGSNLLIADAGIAEPVITLGPGFRRIEEIGSGIFRVGGGVSLMKLSQDLSRAGWSGLEFAGGIPGRVGGAVCMNAGAHGGEFGSIVQSVHVVHSDGQRGVLSSHELDFRYRHAALPSGAIVTDVELKLTAGDPGGCAERRATCLAERKARQPLTLPSFGSVFRNPPGAGAAGELLEKAGMKGVAKGGAEISLMHANWIVNPSRTATAADVIGLISECRDQCRVRFDVELVPEVVCWGISLL